jgi:hypothetical protein
MLAASRLFPVPTKACVDMKRSVTSNIRVNGDFPCDFAPGPAGITLVIEAIKAAGLKDLNVWMVAQSGGIPFDQPLVDNYIALAVAHQADLRAVIFMRNDVAKGEDYPANVIGAMAKLRASLTTKIPVGATDGFTIQSVGSRLCANMILTNLGRPTWLGRPTSFLFSP